MRFGLEQAPGKPAIGEHVLDELDDAASLFISFDPGNAVVGADSEIAKDRRQIVSVNGLYGSGRICEPEDVITFVLIALQGDLTPQVVHIAIVFIAIRDHENMIAFKANFEQILHLHQV